jgi:hypothetical protein
MPDIPRRRFKYTYLSEVFQLDLETAHGDLLIGNTSGNMQALSRFKARSG